MNNKLNNKMNNYKIINIMNIYKDNINILNKLYNINNKINLNIFMMIK